MNHLAEAVRLFNEMMALRAKIAMTEQKIISHLVKMTEDEVETYERKVQEIKEKQYEN